MTEVASASDYLAVKKRKLMGDMYPEASASKYVENKQYLTIQTTAVLDCYGDPEPVRRFYKDLPEQDLAYFNPKLEQKRPSTYKCVVTEPTTFTLANLSRCDVVLDPRLITSLIQLTNYLDLFAKAFVGIFFWAYFTKTFVL